MGQVHHGSATTTEAVRRAIQHSHVWTAPADQGFGFGHVKVAGAGMSSARRCVWCHPPALMDSADPLT